MTGAVPHRGRWARLVLALAVPAVAAGSVAPPAVGTWTARDATGDVVVEDGGRPGGRSASYADVERLTVVHDAVSVRVEVQVADVVRHARSLEVLLATPDGRRHRAYSLRLLDMGDQDGLLRDGRDSRCPGLEARISPREDVAVLTVPRTCLGRPRWVRVGAVYEDVRDLDLESDHPVLLDDALRDGEVGDRPVLGDLVLPG